MSKQSQRYPTGARPLLVEETARRKSAESRFVAILEEARFAEIILPIIDFTEPYAAVIDTVVAKMTYRFVDRDGELVSIRSDFTPLVARALAPALEDQKLPLRVFYRGDVIRCEPTRLGSNHEMFQIGAELIGDESVEADVEILQLAARLVRDSGIEPLIVWTDASLVERFDENSRIALLTKRLSPSLPPIVRKLIGSEASIEDVRSFAPDVADRIEAIRDRTSDDAAFSLHLDDLGSAAGYYTGLRFRVFGSDPRTPVAQGGRYDQLYGRFGSSAPAVGFTFTVDDANRDS
jgi:ATP phosphoribosyltransferase regulatory subunit